MGKSILLVVTALSFLVTPLPAPAFDAPEDDVPPLHASIEGPNKVEPSNTPFQAMVRVKNAGAEIVAGTMRLMGIDGWQTDPGDTVTFQVEPNAETNAPFTVTAPATCYNAHYPLHAYIEFQLNGEKKVLHPILIFETSGFPTEKIKEPQRPWRPYSIPENTSITLQNLRTFRVLICNQDHVDTLMPIGWQGTHDISRAVAHLDEPVVRGTERPAIAMHPAWYSGYCGAVILEFPVHMPLQTPLRLQFANAIRDHQVERGEPASDGVTFRVRVAPWDAPDTQLGEIAFEKHTQTKIWEDASVDLSAFAGKDIRLQFEAHPGPANDTTCDGCFWAEPTLIAGNPEQRNAKPAAPARTIGKVSIENDHYDVLWQTGTCGALDAHVTFRNGDKEIGFTGFLVRALGKSLNDEFQSVRVVDESSGETCRIRHTFDSEEGKFDLVTHARVEHNALHVQFTLENTPNPRPWFAPRIEELALGTWTDHASRVYAGMGNVVVEPQKFTLHFDGHQLASSFVGFDFDGGISIVEAVDVPPDALKVEPGKRHYALHAPLNQTLVLIPAPDVWSGVRTWREIDSRPAAAGVPALAGRFVIDLWGGKYIDSAQALERTFRYGVTDAIVFWHAWQRWGYDYRLPDIYPPNAFLGTHDEFRKLAETCKNHNVLFAVHDNYIDFYPDATDFSYEHVSFDASGQPQRGWFNPGRGAQAYRFRPDRFQPFMKRNLTWIRDDFAPTAYFIDVWSSIMPHDFWTCDGQFYDRTVTRKMWGEAFAWIRDYLGGAPQVSESGHDQLIGWLDGGQTNHLRWGHPATGTHGMMVWNFPAKDGERIPWLDAAYHDRFIWHGAGYEQRYVSGLDPRSHGVNSDDYICTEVLTGHPALTHRPFGRDVVRKYWLLHDLMRAFALRRIQNVEFVDNDIHRIHVTWENGEVWVNRGEEDWTVQDTVLPQYGLLARADSNDGTVHVCIARHEDFVVEKAESPHALFVNARPKAAEPQLPEAELENLTFEAPRHLHVTLRWKVPHPIEDGLRVFLHAMDAGANIVFQGDFPPQPSTGTWENEVVVENTFPIPDQVLPESTLELRTGLYNPKTGNRYPVGGFTDGIHGIRLAMLQLKGTQDALQGVEWKRLDDPDRLGVEQRVNRNNKPVDFGPVTTEGALRLEREGNGVRITPLPDSPPFQVTLSWDKLPWKLPKPTSLEACTEDGTIIEKNNMGWENNTVSFVGKPGVFAYKLEVSP